MHDVFAHKKIKQQKKRSRLKARLTFPHPVQSMTTPGISAIQSKTGSVGVIVQVSNHWIKFN